MDDRLRSILFHTVLGLTAFVGLYLSRIYSFLLFHTAAELISIVIASSIFILAWNSRFSSDNRYLQFIGISYLFVGVLDLIHTLAYDGMNIFRGYTANLPTQFWLGARYLEAVTLLSAPYFIRRKLQPFTLFITYALITGGLTISIFSGIFPDAWHPGSGLTLFKIGSEYVIIVVLALSMLLLWRERDQFEPKVMKLILVAILVTIASEFMFTLYISVYGASNMIGHYLKIVSFVLMYEAVVVTGLTRPFDLLFRNLKQMEEEMRHMAHHDSLTGLPNRRLFTDILELELAHAERHGKKIALLFVDLDRFKEINDSLGHKIGDLLLREVASRLKGHVRKTDSIGRIGGDEFNIILTNFARVRDVSEMARKLVESIGEPYMISGHELKITSSIGVSIYPDDGKDADTLFRCSDAAMYAAKDSGRNSYLFYDRSMAGRSVERIT
jgi:diguanylate cyclase (GGDEF)-like protein